LKAERRKQTGLCGLTLVAGASQAEEDYDFQRIRTRNSVFISRNLPEWPKGLRPDAVEQVRSAPISPSSNNRASCRADIDQTSNGSRISGSGHRLSARAKISAFPRSRFQAMIIDNASQ
jgi:hypothetical protein